MVDVCLELYTVDNSRLLSYGTDVQSRFAFLKLLGVLFVEIGSIVLLTHLGAAPFMHVDLSDLQRWFRETAPLDALMASIRIVVLAGAWWLLVATVVSTIVAPERRVPRFLRIGLVRHLAAATMAVTLSGTVGFTPAIAMSSQPVAVTVDASGAVLPVGATIRPTAQTGQVATGTFAGASDTDDAPSAFLAVNGTTVTVAPGDSLWTISRRHLTEMGADASGRRLAAYWSAVVARNRDRLISGNPDLIYPGETILLPPIERR